MLCVSFFLMKLSTFSRSKPISCSKIPQKGKKLLESAKSCSKAAKHNRDRPDSKRCVGEPVKTKTIQIYGGDRNSSRAIILATLCDCLDSKGCEYSISTSASRRFKLHGLIGKKKKAFSITVRSAGWRQVAEILWTNCRQLDTDLWTKLSIEL